MKLIKFLLLFFLTASSFGLQANMSPAIKDLDLFLQPLQMTRAGLFNFFDKLYNAKWYVEENFFPDRFIHLKEFLAHGKQTGQNDEYTVATVGLFSKKLKECVYVSAYEYDNFLVELPYLVEHHYQQKPLPVGQKKEKVKELLYQQFLNNYDQFKDNPLTFLDTLSDTLLTTIDGSKHDEARTALRNSIVRFLEIGLSKLLWDSTDAQLWHHVKQISMHLYALEQAGIITEQNLDELYWSLLLRLGYFITIIGSDLSLELYQAIQADAAAGNGPLFMLEEQEELALPRREYAQRMVLDAVAIKHANQLGIVTA